MRERCEKSAADYMAIAIAPVLIMVLVGALVFFLAAVLYQESVPRGLHWVLFWFVMASVLVSRIAIGVDSDRAIVYALALGGVTALWIVRFIEPPFAAIALLGVIWWCANKLTWSCTFIDEEEDASGVGLLEVAHPPGPAAADPVVDAEPPLEEPAGSLAPATAPAGRGRAQVPGRRKERRVAAVPGLWVVYFSLGALPLFGVGQALLPSGDQSRTEALGLVACYVAAALGLLLVTSFLGLRRYLRQRGVLMPGPMAFDWLVRGAVMVGVVLVLAILLPRPEAAYTLSALAGRVGSGEPRSRSDARGAAFGAQAPQEQGRARAADADAAKGSADPPSGNASQGSRGEAQSSSAEGRQMRGGDGGGDAAQNSARGEAAGPTTMGVRSAGGLGNILKWVLHVILGAVALVLVVRHGRSLLEGLRALWADLRAFWGRLLGGGRETAAVRGGASTESERASLPFAAFEDPFRGGRSADAPEELVRYTFEALQAWAEQYGWGRGTEETPLEFGARLQRAVPDMAGNVGVLTGAYVAWAYAGRKPGRDCLEALRRVWLQMQAG